MHLMTKIRPITGESIRSFLVRLALSNDYATVQQVLFEFSDFKHLKINSCDQSLLSFAEEAANLTETYQLQPFEDNYSPSDAHLGYRTLMDKTPNICPMCMTSQRHTCADWQLYPITHCPVHDVKLISTCVCSEDFSWDEDLLHYGCSKCDRNWKTIADFQQKDATPIHVHHFNQLNKRDRINFIEDLFTAIMRALRPYASVHYGIRQLPNYVPDWASVSKLAYALLTDRKIIEQWLSSLCNVRQNYAVLGEKAIFYPFTKMQRKLNHTWLVSGFKPSMNNVFPSSNTLPSNHQTTCSARNKAALINNVYETDELLINHLDQTGFADMLNCELSLVRDLFKLPSISTVTNVGRGRFSFIDISDFISQTREQNTAKSNETKNLKELLPLLEKYTLTCEQALVEIYKHNLPVYIDQTAQSLVDIVCINEAVLTDFLESTFVKSLNAVPVAHAKRILGLPRERVVQLGKLGYIDELISKPKTLCYTGKSIASFLEDFICVEHWAESHNTCASIVIQQLRFNGVNAVLPPYIYEKSEQLISVLDASLLVHTNKPEQFTLFD